MGNPEQFSAGFTSDQQFRDLVTVMGNREYRGRHVGQGGMCHGPERKRERKREEVVASPRTGL